MKKNILIALLLVIGFAGFAFAAPTSSFQPTLLPIFNNTYDLGSNSLVWRNIYTNQICLSTDCKTAWPTGGGGSGGGTFSTTTSSVTGQLINYPSNNTDIVNIGSTSTTTGKFYFDPNTITAVLKGLTTFTYGSSTAFTVTGNAYIPTLANLTSNGFVKTSGGTGALSVDTNTYLQTVTADSPLSGSGTSGSHLTLSTAGTWSGNAGTATALAANGTNCSSGNYPLGVDASGNSENCTAANTGTVTSVTLATPNSTLSLGGTNPVTTSGTINADLNLNHANTWGNFLQQFVISSSTSLSAGWAKFGETASSTFDRAGVLTLATPLAVSSGGTGAGTLTGCLTGNGTGAITGSGTCNTSNASVSSVGLSDSNSTLTIGGTPVTTSGTLTATLNLGHANNWTALQQFQNASSTILSASYLSVGATATTTIGRDGTLTLAGLSTGCLTNTSGVVSSTGVACGSGGGGGISDPFTHPSYAGSTVSATTTQVSFNATSPYSLTASSTALLQNATTTTFQVNGSLYIPNSASQSPITTGQIGWDTTVGQFKVGDGSATQVYTPGSNFGFAYATTSWGTTATTTIRVGPSVDNITVTSAYCETDVGTVGVSLWNGTNRATYIPTASTTINKFTYAASNNSFAAGTSIRVDLGTPASAPTLVSCRFKYTYDSQ